MNAVPSPIIEALLTAGTVCVDNRQKPLDMSDAFREKYPSFRETVKIDNLRGAAIDDVRTIVQKETISP